MNIFDVLKNEKPVFVLDDIEDKKTKNLIMQINSQMSNFMKYVEEFEDFASSQLNGENNKKIVMAKSLRNVYGNWAAINNAYAMVEKEEKAAISVFENAKAKLVGNLKTLLADSKKLPVVSVYDVFGGDFVYAKKGHTVVILGNNNTAVIEALINDISNKIFVEGNFERVESVELSANYSNIEKNVEECKRAVDEIYYNKPSKEEKILNLIEVMEKAARDLVFFATYKNDIKMIGANMKEVDVYEKELFKKYVPLKKQFTKLLKVSFVDICDLSHNEQEFPTQEFKAVDIDDLFEE